MTTAELRNAIIAGNREAVKSLISLGAALDPDAFIVAAQKGSYDIMCYLVSQGKVDMGTLKNSLPNASIAGQLVTVKYLVAIGVDPRTYTDGVLFMAVASGHLSVARYLVSKGSNILSYNDSPLYSAVKRKHLDMVIFITDICDKLPQKILHHPGIKSVLEAEEHSRRLIAKHLDAPTVLSRLVARYY